MGWWSLLWLAIWTVRETSGTLTWHFCLNSPDSRFQRVNTATLIIRTLTKVAYILRNWRESREGTQILCSKFWSQEWESYVFVKIIICYSFGPLSSQRPLPNYSLTITTHLRCLLTWEHLTLQRLRSRLSSFSHALWSFTSARICSWFLFSGFAFFNGTSVHNLFSVCRSSPPPLPMDITFLEGLAIWYGGLRQLQW